MPCSVRPFFCSAILLACAAGTATAQVTIPDTGRYVIDRAGLLDESTASRLEGWLRELEEKTTAQLKVLTVATTGGEDFFGFVQRHAELWKLGQAGKDNGALIAVAVKERQVRVHTGYGLEGALPDSWCGSLSRNVFAANFRKGQYAEGLFEGTVMVANKIADESNVSLTGVPSLRHAQRAPEGGVTCGAGLFPLIIVMIMISSMSRRRRNRSRWGGLWEGLFWASMFGNMMGGGGRSWGGRSGGGFGRGFGGSFGGGGRFGGGGGGASW